MIITRHGGTGILTRIKVVIDDEYSFLLKYGAQQNIPIDSNIDTTVIECRCQMFFNSRFTIKKASKVKTVNITLGLLGIHCEVEYKNGTKV